MLVQPTFRIGNSRPRLVNDAQYIAHFFLYHALVRFLPSSAAPGGRLWRNIRSWTCRPLFTTCGYDVNVERGALIGRRTVSIGSHSGIGAHTRIHTGTQIGDNVMIAANVLVVTCNHRTERIDIPMIQQGRMPVRPVRISDDVWIGERAIILPGVTIGAHSIIGAGAVVSRDVPPYAVVVGNPGRIVKYRYQQHTESIASDISVETGATSR